MYSLEDVCNIVISTQFLNQICIKEIVLQVIFITGIYNNVYVSLNISDDM